jgi:hypothetical protein
VTFVESDVSQRNEIEQPPKVNPWLVSLRATLAFLRGSGPAIDRESPIIGLKRTLFDDRGAQLAPDRLGPLLTVVLACVFGLWTLRTESLPVPYPNDSSVHILTLQFALQQIKGGHLPFTGWFPYLSLGSPFLMHYQSTPAVLGALLGLIIGAPHAFSFILYYLLALWPISVYFSMRLLGWDRWPASAAAAVAPLLTSVVGYGYEHESYVWWGSGLWPQLWAMWMLPLAIGFGWQAISRHRHYFAAMIATALTIAFHFLTAYYLGLAIIVLVLIRPTKLFRRAWPAAVVSVGAIAATLWVIVPLVVYGKWTAENEFIPNTFWDDSYGARTIGHWLITGQIYDSGRFPVITVLVGIGLVVCLFRSRRDERARVLVALWIMSLLLYFGRTTFRSAIDLLPGNKDLLLHRYIASVQLCGIFVAGVGVIWLGSTAWRSLRLGARSITRRAPRVRRILTSVSCTAHSRAQALPRLAPARVRRFVVARRRDLIGGTLCAAAIVAILTPAWRNIAAYDYLSAQSGIRTQLTGVDAGQASDVDTLVSKAQSIGPGRFYAGMPSNWGRNFEVGQIPVYIYLSEKGIDTVGFTLRTYSLMTGPEAYFDEANPGDYEIMGIRYLLLPGGQQPPINGTTFVEQLGNYCLYVLGEHFYGQGNNYYFQMVDTTTPIAANASNLGHATASFLTSELPDESIIPTIAYAGQLGAPPTRPYGANLKSIPGVVISESLDLANGKASADVSANRTAVVMLKVSYDPGWRAIVDGIPVSTEMLAPALIGVTVIPGNHHVVFTYHGYGRYPELFALSGAGVLIFAITPFVWRRARRRFSRRRVAS